MPTIEEILKDAQSAPPKATPLAQHLNAIKALRAKNYSWRDIAEFLGERGIETDHTALMRFMRKHEERWEVPTSDAYFRALVKLAGAGRLSRNRMAMLFAHFDAHNRTITYTELAAAAARAGANVNDAKPHRYANLEYGKLAKLLGETIGMEFLPSGTREAPFYSSAIGVGNSARPDGADFELVMHHELAKAIERFKATPCMTDIEGGAATAGESVAREAAPGKGTGSELTAADHA